MTIPDIRAVIEEFLTRSDLNADTLPIDDDLLDLIGLGDLRPMLESLPDTPVTFTTRDGDPSEARLRISYDRPDVP